jgi:hypothetical protein
MTTPKPSPSAEACRVAHEYRLSQPDHFTMKSVEALARALDAFAAAAVEAEREACLGIVLDDKTGGDIDFAAQLIRARGGATK